jgi:hypothetical protein
VRLGRLITTVAIATLALPAAAAADDFQQVFQDYKDNGRLDGCYKPYQLYNAGRQIPPDVEQYAPGFGDALSAGQAGCNRGGRQPVEEPPPISAGTPGPGAPSAPKRKRVKEPPAPKAVPEPVLAKLPQPKLQPATSGVAGETPGGLIVLLMAAGAALLIALAWAIAWFMGWSPERLTKPLFAAFSSVWDRVSTGR